MQYRFIFTWPSLYPLFRRSRLMIAWSIWSSALFLLIFNLILLLLSHPAPEANTWSPFFIALLYPTLGLLVTRRHPGNLVGWLLSALGLAITLLGFSKAYALYGAGTLPGSVALAWLSGWLWGIILGIIPLLILFFPTGHLLSRRWHLLIWITMVNTITLLGFGAIYPGGLYADPTVHNPLAFTDSVLIATGFTVTQAMQVMLILAAILTLFIRFHGAIREERQQIKWILAAFVLNGFLLVIDQWVPLSFWGSNIDGFGGIILSLAIGAAILRYRLWDIDIIINRTLVYGVLTACIVGIYIVVVGYLSVLFHTSSNLLISLIATSVVALLFQPLRSWLQQGVNHLFYGQRDEPYVVLMQLGRRLETTLAPDAILPAIVETVAHALKLPYAAIALKRGDEFTPAATYGAAVEGALTLPLIYQSEVVGQLALGPRQRGESFTPADRRLLEDLARQVGIAAHAVRLTNDLQRSREQLILTREEERRRLRRELHDDLGPQLGGLTLQVGAIHNQLRQDPAKAEALLAELGTEIEVAARAIRRLAYQLRPPTLDELGLMEAIRAYALECQQRSTSGTGDHIHIMQVKMEVSEPVPPLPAAVEVVAYRIAQEAITNVVRHAQAQTCWIALAVTHDPETLHLEIKDDGSGIPSDAHAGIGLLAMRERAEEVGGSCIIGPAPSSHGTCVLVSLPIRKEE